jgi:hypothetical protein
MPLGGWWFRDFHRSAFAVRPLVTPEGIKDGTRFYRAAPGAALSQLRKGVSRNPISSSWAFHNPAASGSAAYRAGVLG